jgi:L-2,4-diaminobutyric acid acetyltransferase
MPQTDSDPALAGEIHIGPPTVDDGVDLWRQAAASQVLDVNSRYAYLLWCRDFSATSVVARRDGDVVGFITGYRRPDQPGTLMVWQVAVDAAARGEGVAGRMLDTLVGQVAGIDHREPVEHLETTVSPDNEASIAMFTAFARRRDASMAVEQLFSTAQLSDDADHHEPENLYRIGPFLTAVAADPAQQRRTS